MTISSTLNRVSYTGNGVSTAFAVSFPFHAQADLIVLSTVIATGVQTTKTLTTHYTISGTTDALGHYSSGGSVDFITPPASTERITIYRDPARTQALDLQDASAFPAENVEAQLDYVTMLVQRVEDLIGRSLRQPDGDATAVGLLPSSVERASKYLSFDSSGNPTAVVELTPGSVTISAFSETCLDDANADTLVETITDGATAETAPASGDLLLLSDVSANSGRKMTLANILKVVSDITEDTSPDKTADFVLTYDASAAAAKKVTPTNLVPFASQAQVTAMTSTTTALTPNHNKIALGTQVAATSGTEIGFTSIPPGVRRVTMRFAGVSTNGTSNLISQIGDAGGYETSGYLGSTVTLNDGGVTASNFTDGLGVTEGTPAATATFHGIVTWELLDAATFSWVGRVSLSRSDGDVVTTGSISKSLSAELDRLRVTTQGGANTFDTGVINISYER